jgi:plasmid stabilization system protein ParE
LASDALEDLSQIARYYKVDKRNPRAAERAVQAIRDACSRVGADPGIGKQRSDIETGLYSKPVRRYPYTIFYRLAPPGAGSRIEVARILHQRRDVEAAVL